MVFIFDKTRKSLEIVGFFMENHRLIIKNCDLTKVVEGVRGVATAVQMTIRTRGGR
jgi:hypothetical protein